MARPLTPPERPARQRSNIAGPAAWVPPPDLRGAADSWLSIVHLEQPLDDRPRSRVLVIDDDARLRRIIAMSFTVRGHAVREAGDVGHGLKALADALPDLLIVDMNLPDGTGWDVLRGAALPAAVRIVVVTAGSVDPRTVAEFHGVTYLPKPFALGTLLRLVDDASGGTMTSRSPSQHDVR